MSRFLRTLGLMILAVATVLLVAGETGAVSSHYVDVWFMPAAQAGAIALVAGLVLSLLSPFGRMVRRWRCVRCGTTIEKNQTYCHDHLKNVVQEYQDHTRTGY